MGAGSRIGSCPSVASAPDVAELSRMSVLGCAWGIGVGVAAGAPVPVSDFFSSAAFWSAAFCSAVLWTAEFVSALVFFWSVAAGCDGLVCPLAGVVVWSAGFGCSGKGGCPGAGVVTGCAGAVFGTGVCGTPEPGFGVAGLFCAQPQRPNIKTMEKKSDALGERCIVFRELPTIRWMQRAATQMADNLKSALPNLREGFAIQLTSRATALQPLV